MTSRKFILRSLRHYWRVHLLVVIGVAVAAGILSGSLVVGDSVRASLRMMGLARLGRTTHALIAGERYFTEGLAGRIAGKFSAPTAPLLMLRGTVSADGGRKRAFGVQILGVTDEFWQLSGGGAAPPAGESFGKGAGSRTPAFMNRALAGKLGLTDGDPVLARIEMPGFISRDAPLSGAADLTEEISSQVAAVLTREQFGAFSLQAEQIPPMTLIVPLRVLQEAIEKPGLANILLIGGNDGVSSEGLDNALRSCWTLSDASLAIREIKETVFQEIYSDRIFLDPPAVDAVRTAVPGVDGVLTYLVNAVGTKDKTVPYSMVTGVEGEAGFLDPPLGREEIALNTWLADDMGAGEGDEITLTYFVVAGGRELVEESARFRVGRILPMDHPAMRPDWMPDFPGISDVDNCRDWDPGIPIDNSLIRDEDEDYWDQYKGTPKALIALEAAQAIWSNRFGDLTGLRFVGGEEAVDGIKAEILKQLEPSDIGLVFTPLRELALRAAEESMDFGSLFASMSFYLVLAALILVAVLLAFSIETRSDQVGLLLGLGLKRRQVKRLFFREAMVLAVAGTLVGVGLGTVYTRVTLWALSGVWSEAAPGVQFIYSAQPATLAAGLAASLIAAGIVIALSLRRFRKFTARELLGSRGASVHEDSAGGRAREKRLVSLPAFWLGLLALGGAAALAVSGRNAETGGELAGAFFGAGGLVLIGGLCAVAIALRRMGGSGGGAAAMSYASVGRRNALRRRGRSRAVVTLMAAGVFLVLAMNAFRLNARLAAGGRDSGTGGFGLIGESTLPVYDNLNTVRGREVFALEDGDFQGVSVVPFRVKEGDDASCLNLNRAQQPRLLGVDPEQLRRRGAFRFSQTLGSDEESPWALLGAEQKPGDPVPGIIDESSAMWMLHKKLGDTLEYTAENGDVFQVRLVAFLKGSILQGSVVIDDELLLKKFPSTSGYRYFLIDVPPDRLEGFAGTMEKMLLQRGFSATPAWERLAQLNTVQNTYLGIFTALGGLGLILGTVGLAVITVRNAVERRGEFALLRAVGLPRPGLRRMICAEHGFLLAAGVGIGGLATLVAVLPQVLRRAEEVPWLSLLLWGSAIFLAGYVLTWLGAWMATRSTPIDALRED